MKRQLKIFFLRCAKILGLLRLLRYLTRNHLRILCYHGFSESDEHEFRSKYFIRPETLIERLELVRRLGLDVIPLNDAVDALWDNNLPSNAVVITIDDGLVSVLKHAAPILKKFKSPATVYVTTYYSDRQVPVCAFAAQYLIWKAGKNQAAMLKSGEPNKVPRPPMIYRDLKIDLANKRGVDDCTDKIVKLINAQASDVDRQVILRELEALLLPSDGVIESRLFHIMSKEELSEIADFGIDIQLHTHRHHFPVNRDLVEREIVENIASLKDVSRSKLAQFCYPSGQYDQRQFLWMKELGLRSATTCVKGLVNKNSNPFLLNRILDGENVTSIELEAELSGFSVLLEIVSRLFRRDNSSMKQLASQTIEL
jgi:peptidoglycan/xylan/chitin deacetylase (PgdA/CDA1 family)